MIDALDALFTLQREDGGFDSVVVTRQGAFTDRNGFTAALVLRALRNVQGPPELGRLRTRALRFLEDCATDAPEGGFAFWPPHLRPAWAATVPADVDDTALLALELHRHGRRTREQTVRSVCTLLPHRVGEDTGQRPPWIAPGSFHTWLAADDGRQVVDCCVNANVAALMARLDLRHLPGYAEAIRTVVGGLVWARGNARRLDTLAPFYPSHDALRDAVEHAIECGAHGLRVAIAHLPARSAAPTEACCRGAYAQTTWHCSAVPAARAVAAIHHAGRLPCPS